VAVQSRGEREGGPRILKKKKAEKPRAPLGASQTRATVLSFEPANSREARLRPASKKGEGEAELMSKIVYLGLSTYYQLETVPFG